MKGKVYQYDIDKWPYLAIFAVRCDRQCQCASDFEAGRGSLIPSCCAWQAAVEQAGLVFIEY